MQYLYFKLLKIPSKLLIGSSRRNRSLGETPQKATSIPLGIKNSGFKILRMPPILNFPGGLNSWMGFAARWGGNRAFAAMLIENGIRFGIPATFVGRSYTLYGFLTFAIDWAVIKTELNRK